MKNKSLFSYIILLLLISGCIPVSPVPTLVPTQEPTATIQPKPQPDEFWNGMEPGWTVFWRPPSLHYPYYDPAGYIWALETRGVYRWNIESGKMDLFTQADDLPYNITSLSAFEGKMWATTQNGIVASFDGENWAEEKLTEKALRDFSQTPGRLWVYSDEEKRTFFYENGKWNEFKETPKDRSSDWPLLRAKAQSKDGDLWFYAGDVDTWSYDGETWKKHNNLSSVRNIFSSPDGTVYFVFSSIVILYDGQNLKPVVFPGEYYTYDMTSQFPTQDGDLWVSRYSEKESAFLVHSNGSVDTLPYKPLPTPVTPKELYFYERGWTPSGLMVSDGKEISLYKEGKLRTFSTEDEEFNSLLRSHTFIGFAPDGALWLREYGNDLVRYNGSTIEYPYSEYRDSYYMGNNTKINSKGELWSAVGTELIKFRMGEKPVKYKVNMQLSDFFFAPDGSIWVKDYEGFIARIDPKDLADKTVLNAYYIQIGEGVVGQDLPARAIKAAPNGDLWVYVDEAGFFRYDGKSWKFFRLGEVGNASNFAINSRGEIWVGQTNHLSKFDGQEWIRYERNCICPSDLTIAPDDTVWFITGCDGVMHFDESEWTHYPREKELSGISPYDVVSAPDGAMWFISGEAWIRYQP